jgi:hypothetical protein
MRISSPPSIDVSFSKYPLSTTCHQSIAKCVMYLVGPIILLRCTRLSRSSAITTARAVFRAHMLFLRLRATKHLSADGAWVRGAGRRITDAGMSSQFE